MYNVHINVIFTSSSNQNDILHYFSYRILTTQLKQFNSIFISHDRFIYHKFDSFSIYFYNKVAVTTKCYTPEVITEIQI